MVENRKSESRKFERMDGFPVLAVGHLRQTQNNQQNKNKVMAVKVEVKRIGGPRQVTDRSRDHSLGRKGTILLGRDKSKKKQTKDQYEGIGFQNRILHGQRRMRRFFVSFSIPPLGWTVAVAFLLCLLNILVSVNPPAAKDPDLSQLPVVRTESRSAAHSLQASPRREPVFRVSNPTDNHHHDINKNDLLLSVPFYIYAELDMINEMMCGNVTLRQSIDDQASLFGPVPKHADDYYFIRGAMKHPLRVHNPADAKLFVVPVPLNHIVFSAMYKDTRSICWNNMCGRDLLVYTDEVLGNSTWFQRYKGNDHLAPFGIWGWDHHAIRGKKSFRNIGRCNIVGFGESNRMNRKNRLYFKKFYVGRACPPAATKRYDYAMVASLKPKDPRFQSRTDICNWLNATVSPRETSEVHNATITSNDPRWSICGRGAQCPALAESRFGFHVRGDSLGANRLFDTLLSGTVPIFTMKEQYGINPGWFDWDKISYFAPVQNRTAFLQVMKRITADRHGYDEKLQQVLLNRALFDWTTIYPFDTYMYMLQAHLWPNSRRNSTKFTALKLP